MFLVCVYLESLSVLLVNLIEIGRISIAHETSKLGTEKLDMRNEVSDQASSRHYLNAAIF